MDTGVATCTQKEYRVNMKAEIWMMCLQAKKQQKLPASHQKLEVGKYGTVSLKVLKRNQPCSYLKLRLLTSRTVRQSVKPQSFWTLLQLLKHANTLNFKALAQDPLT